MQPLIGITCKYSYDGQFAVEHGMGVPGQQWHLLPHDYIHAVELTGGIPVLLPVYDDYNHLTEAIERLDGVVFAGGNDVGPLFYGAHPSRKTGNVTVNRDRQELRLAKYILKETDLPVLFICRGSQIFNVALGGVLYQDVEESGFENHMVVNVPATEVCHQVDITAGSLLERILQKKTVAVNSLHHQAVRQAGEGLMVAARADDDIIEALELPQREAFTLAVQWHPEMLVDLYEDHRRLFETFIMSAGRL